MIALLTQPVLADLPSVVAQAKPSVFPVGVYDPLASPRFNFRGSGFVVGNGRLLVTNVHVLPDDFVNSSRKLVILVGTVATAGASGGTPDVRELTVAGLDREHDLALLEISGAPLPALNLADAAAREGQSVALIGFPIGGVLGFSAVTHRAIVSSIVPIVLPTANAGQLNAASIARLRQGAFDILQLDGTAYPGNSGGPLLDTETGQVIGIINMVLVKAGRESALTNPTGITYAIPARWLKQLMGRK